MDDLYYPNNRECLDYIYEAAEKAGYRGMIVDLSDKKVLECFRLTVVGEEDDPVELLDQIKGFVNSDKVRKTEIVRRLIKSTSLLDGAYTNGNDDRNSPATVFFMSLLVKDLISVQDARMCISELRKKDLRKYIPLVMLKENGYIRTFNMND